MNSLSLTLEHLPPGERAKVEHVLVEFDRSWRAGRIVDAVRGLPSAGWRRAAIVELVKIDLDRRWQAGQRPAVSHYLKQFPDLGGAAAVPPELLLVEYQLREQHGPAPALSEYAENYPAQVAALESLLLATRTTMTPPQADDAGHSKPFPPAGDIPESFGRYRIQRRLGQGGMGTVYLAFDPQLEREVALKIPGEGPTASPETTEQILREARAAAALHHPNICPVYDVGVIENVPFITSRYVAGETLSAVAKRGELSDAQVAKVVAQIARALEYAHSHGVIHRDLKPANVMIDGDDRPVVTDFGLARRVAAGEDSHATMSNAAGTPAYMAPEQVAATRAGPSSDIFSLGVVLYELLTGRRPFQGSPVELFDQLLRDPLPPPSKFRPGVPPALEAVCVRATAKDPADRFPSMAAMAEALEAISFARRSRGPKIAIAAVLLLAVVALTVTFGNRLFRTPEKTSDVGKPDVRSGVPAEAKRKPRPPAGPEKFVPLGERPGVEESLLKDRPKLKFDPQPVTTADWVQVLQKYSDAGDPITRTDYRLAAIEALGKLNDRAAMPALVKQLKSPNEMHWAMKRECAVVLGCIGGGSPEVANTLAERVADKWWKKETGHVKGQGSRNPFWPTYKDPEHGGKDAALEALIAVAPDRVAATLRRALRQTQKVTASENQPMHAGDPGLVRAWAAERLVEYGDAETVQALCVALTDEYELVRKRAAEALLELKAPAAANALFDRVADDLWMAERFCQLQGEMNGMSYSDPEWGGKVDALAALKAISPPERVAAALAKAEQSSNDAVRAWAKRERTK